MTYCEFPPGHQLEQYVKCYFIIESNTPTSFSENLLPSGHIEVIFNLGESRWQSSINENMQLDPPIELLGQLSKPLHVSTSGKTFMLGIRFFAHTASMFFHTDLSEFNNKLIDLTVIMGQEIKSLHSHLINSPDKSDRVVILDDFLINMLFNQRDFNRYQKMIENVIKEMQQSDFIESIASMAKRYNMTPRHFQRIFTQNIGVNPKTYLKIYRFRNGLNQLSTVGNSLTAIAYSCGYYDQSHFIKDFKDFSGTTPSKYFSI